MSESETSSAAQIFRIKRQISQTKQGIADVTTYFNFLKGLLVELDLYRNIEFESAADAKKFNDIMERDRAIQFLVGLNPEYDEVCHQLLAKEPFPDLEEAFVYVRGEESNRGLKREIDKARTENSDIASTSGSQMAQTRIGTNQNLGMSEQQQAQSGVQSDGANNNSVAGILLSQLASAKYVKIWEGNLSGQRQGQPVFITRLEGYRSATASETLAANWPATMQIVRLISQDHMYNKQYVGKADFLVFRALNQHGFLGQLQEKKLCAVIQVPSQTLLLSVSDKACRLIGMLFPGDMIIFKPQISNQQQHPQLQQQQHTQLQQQQQLPQLQQQQQIPQLQQQQLPQLQQQQMPQLQPQQQQIPQLPQLQQQQMPQLQQQPPLPQQQQQQNQLSGLQPQQQLPNLQQLQQIPQQQQMVGAGMGPGYVQDPGWSQLVSQGQASSQGQPTMPGGGRMG